MTVNAIVWGENVHERENADVAAIYPGGMHAAIAAALNESDRVSATTATLQEPEHGLPQERVDEADVMFWWGHAAHGDVADAVVERVVEAVWAGLGLVVLHSAHFSKVFKRLMGTPCALTWREAGERERLWVTAPNHPIVAGLPQHFELENEEMYGEPFGIPDPMETVLIGWFQGGEVFRSGVTFRRGAGRIFYFQPGHETYPTYFDPNVQAILRNAALWAASDLPRLEHDVTDAPNRTVGEALEPIEARGPSLHKDGEKGFR